MNFTPNYPEVVPPLPESHTVILTHDEFCAIAKLFGAMHTPDAREFDSHLPAIIHGWYDVWWRNYHGFETEIERMTTFRNERNVQLPKIT